MKKIPRECRIIVIILLCILMYYIGFIFNKKADGINNYNFQTFVNLETDFVLYNPKTKKIEDKYNVLMKGVINHLNNTYEGKINVNNYSVSGDNNFKKFPIIKVEGGNKFYYTGIEWITDNSNTKPIFSDINYFVVISKDNVMIVVTSRKNEFEEKILMLVKDYSKIEDIYNQLYAIYKVSAK